MLTIISINLSVDPYGMFHLWDKPGFNQNRPAQFNRVRLMKAYDVRRLAPKVIVLGSSRVHLGIRMSHPGWPEAAASRYNLAFDGATAKEMYLYLRHAYVAGPVKLVVLGLDSYHPLAVPARVRPDFDPALLFASENRWPSLHVVGEDLRILASAGTLQESWRTWRAQSDPIANWFAADGQRVGEAFFRRSGESFVEQGPRFYFDQINKDEVRFQLDWRIPTTTRAKAAPPIAVDPLTSLDYIGKIVEFCREHEIDLRIFLTPSHAYQFEITAAAGGWAAVEHGKQALVNLLATDAQNNPDKAPIPLYDFNQYSIVTTEAPPARGSHDEMHFYWDSSHFKEIVGDWVLDRIFGVARVESPLPADFGQRLTAENIVRNIEQLRADHRRFAGLATGDVQELQHWVDDFISGHGIDMSEIKKARLDLPSSAANVAGD